MRGPCCAALRCPASQGVLEGKEVLASPLDSCQRLVDSVTSRVLQQLQECRPQVRGRGGSVGWTKIGGGLNEPHAADAGVPATGKGGEWLRVCGLGLNGRG